MGLGLTVLCVEKMKTRYSILSRCHCFFLLTFWYATRRLLHRFYEVPAPPITRSGSFVPYQGVARLYCNIKCMRSTFWIVNTLLASSHPVYPIRYKCISLTISQLLYLLLSELFTLMQRPPSATKILPVPVSKVYCFRITFLSYALHISFGANSSTNSKRPLRWGWMWWRGINFCLYEKLLHC